jgi:hypothetical protein
MMEEDMEEPIKVLHITLEQYKKYEQFEKEREQFEFWYHQQKEQGSKFIEALKEIHSYQGNCEDALKLKEIASKVLWDTIWDLY